jgi:hypothetical protein
MDGFKTTPKMQCFKEGGSVERATNFTKRDRKNVPEAGMEPTKKVVKKAFGMHDSQQHDGEKTDLTALKKGGRAKKEAGTVRKYKTGGSVENVYGAKKKAGDLDRIEKTKDIKPGKAAAPSKAATKPAFAGSDVEKEKSKPAGHKDPYIKSKESGKSAATPSSAKGGPNKYKTGGGVKKMAVGGSALNDLMQAKELARLANARKYLNKDQQGQFAASEMQQTPAMTGLGQQAVAPAPQAPVGPTSSMIPAQKRGGKAGKCK